MGEIGAIRNWCTNYFGGVARETGLTSEPMQRALHLHAVALSRWCRCAPPCGHSLPRSSPVFSLQVVRELQQQKGENWNVRIGIHTGKLCAGLLGRNKFIYDVFGDTVNLASRLADAAEVDHVNVCV